MPDFDYISIGPHERAALALDTLRGREADHFRLSLLQEAGDEAAGIDAQERIAGLAESIVALRAAYEEAVAERDAVVAAEPEPVVEPTLVVADPPPEEPAEEPADG